MSKITADHLARSAYVYVRQSTPGQVHRNHESRRRQYGLAARAKQLGWSDVVVVDDDLAISGVAERRIASVGSVLVDRRHVVAP